MSEIGNISNLESGIEVRAKLNTVIGAINNEVYVDFRIENGNLIMVKRDLTEDSVALPSSGATSLSDLSDVDVSVATPSDGNILVFRSVTGKWILEAKPASLGAPSWGDITGTLSAQTDLQLELDSKATAEQGALAETALQSGDNVSQLTNDSGYITATSIDTLTGKTLIDYTNDIHADAVHHRIKCVDSGGITAGAPVAFSGFNSGEGAIEVVRANQLTGVAIGLAMQNLTNGIFGLMITSGTIAGIKTDAYPKGVGTANEGDILYVNGLGLLTGDEPTTGFAQPIALLLRKSSNVGALQVLAAYPKQDAADVRFTPAGTIAATNLQAAIQELDTEKASTTALDGKQNILSEGAFVNGDKTKLDGIEAGADVTDPTNVAAAGAVMTTGNQSIDGVKTFTSSPIVPSPTTDLQAATKKYVDDAVTAGGGYTDEMAQDAVGNILTDSSEIDFTYDDATPSITAVLKAGSIDESKLDVSVNASLDLADSALQPSSIGVTVQGYSSVLAATTASFTTADESKLDGIEAGAEVNTINSAVTGEPTGSDVVLNVISLTQAEYDAGSKVATTLYIIKT